jgi:type IV pilus assembly protein PilE
MQNTMATLGFIAATQKKSASLVRTTGQRGYVRKNFVVERVDAATQRDAPFVRPRRNSLFSSRLRVSVAILQLRRVGGNFPYRFNCLSAGTAALACRCNRGRSICMKGHVKGFTLLEVMVTVAVVAILASVSFPSFSDYFKRGRIPDATGRLSALRLSMEQYFQDNESYVGAAACGNDATSSPYFNFSCPIQTDTKFELQASGKGLMDRFAFSVNESSVQRTTSVPAGWSLPAGNCWAVRKDGSC